jgi:hypothetical protein
MCIHSIVNFLKEYVQRSDVTVYSNLNFEKQVSKNRDKGISIVHFYKDEGKYSSNFNTTNF